MIVAGHSAILARWLAFANLIAGIVLLGAVGRVILEAVDVRVHRRLGVYILLKIAGEAEFNLPELLDRPHGRITFSLTIGTRSNNCVGTSLVKKAVDILLRLRDGCAFHTEQEPVEPNAFVVIVLLLLLLLEPLQLATLRLAHLFHHSIGLGLNFGLEGALGIQIGQLVGVVLVTEQSKLVEASARRDTGYVICDGTVEASLGQKHKGVMGENFDHKKNQIAMS